MNSDEKILVVLTPGFANDAEDTTCIPMQQIFIRKLKEACPNVHVFILAFEYPYAKKFYSWCNVPVLAFNGRNKGGLRRLLLRRHMLTFLKTLHAAFKIDVLLSFWYGECALIGKKFGDKNGIKHFCWMWGQDAKKNNKYPSKLRLKENQLIAFSDFLQNEFEKNHKKRPVHVITPGIDKRQFPINNASKDIDILAAGSLIPLKQYDIFIEVIAEIKKTLPTISAVLIGDGPKKNKLQKLIDAAGLQSNISLAGELPHPQLIQYMQRAKLFLHPSSYEGFGIVCIEALCAGATVISFVKPMKQAIENWHIAKDKEEMTTKAIAVLQDPNKEYKTIVPYTIEQTVQMMSELFSF